jgi:aryl-alcohol dehydrogenase-like predicted oxidoreductase
LWGGKETVFPRTGYLFRSEYRSVRALVVLKANIPLERSSALLLHASPITGTSSIAYLEESLKALTVELTAERLSELGG